MEDAELEAMATISRAITALDEGSRARVLRWAVDRYEVTVATLRKPAQIGAASAARDAELESGVVDSKAFNDIADLYDAANPKDGPDKALVVAYWYQVVQDRQDFGSQEVNSSLKHLGHGVSNITSTLTNLMQRTPRLVLQTHKSGKTMQARKKYKLTREGILAVERMIRMRTDGEQTPLAGGT